jgi:hypothetical protein
MDWQGKPPRYRVWVQDQLFHEQRFTWEQCYLEEQFVVLCQGGKVPGQFRNYQVTHELLDPQQARITVVNWHILSGPATIDQQGLITMPHC